MDRDELEDARDELLEDNEDDLEYHITFPSPTLNSDLSPSRSGEKRKSAKDFVFVNSGDFGADAEPVVFLLGWAGCRDKELAKYSKIYEDAGCVTIRYTAPDECVFLEQERVRLLARKLLDLVEEMSLENSPVLFHSFGNGGCVVYQYMIESLRDCPEYEAVLRNFRGQAFDSGPGRVSLASYVRAMAEIGGGGGGGGGDNGGSNIVVKYALAVAAVLYSLLLGLIRRFAGGVFGNGGGVGRDEGDDRDRSSAAANSAPDTYSFDYIVRDETTAAAPYLFIYSAADDVVSPSDVEEVADAKSKSGCEVTKICYEDSKHADGHGHLAAHRESYIAAVNRFLVKCLRESDPTAAVKKEGKDKDS